MISYSVFAVCPDCGRIYGCRINGCQLYCQSCHIHDCDYRHCATSVLEKKKITEVKNGLCPECENYQIIQSTPRARAI
jgi:hypothetical protein